MLDSVSKSWPRLSLIDRAQPNGPVRGGGHGTKQLRASKIARQGKDLPAANIAGILVSVAGYN